MKKNLHRLPFALCLLLAAFGLQPFRLSSSAAADTQPAVEMDPYVVRADRILPAPEQWTYIRVPALALTRGSRQIIAPGYEMLSNLNPGQTKVLVNELQLRQFAATYLWPMLTQVLPRTPVYVVADINQQHAAPIQFVKSSDTWEGDPIETPGDRPEPVSFSATADFGGSGAQQFAAEYGLSQMDSMNSDDIMSTGMGEDTTTDQDLATMAAISSPQRHRRDETVVRPLPDGFVELAMNGGPLAALIRAGEARAGMGRVSEERLAATLSYQLNLFALSSLPQKPPPWFARGLSSLLGSTQVSYKLIEFARVREDLASREMPSLAGILRNESGRFSEVESRLASLLVHFGLFGDNGKYTTRFMQFVNRLEAGDEPTDAMFKEVFGITMNKMETHLAVYARDIAAYKSTNFKGNIPDMPAPAWRDATQSEVARIKAEMYISQANPAKALEELRIAYFRGEREPAMLALLALLEQQTGSGTRARKITKALLDMSAPPPQIHIVAARFQLNDALASKPPGVKLTADETSSLIATLSGALAGGLTTENLCDTLAEIILKSETTPDPDMLAFLQQAAKRFPKNQTISSVLMAAGT